MPLTKGTLTGKARTAAEETITALHKLCAALVAQDMPVLAAKFAKQGQYLARSLYTKGQIGYTSFDMYLR